MHELSRVLIVDDEPDIRNLVHEILEDEGYNVTTADGGEAARKASRVRRPDLILLDLEMPQMDGFQTINRIRSNKLYSDLPIFALTAHAMLDNKEVIEKHGFNGIITKPINTASLAFKIQKTLRRN